MEEKVRRAKLEKLKKHLEVFSLGNGKEKITMLQEMLRELREIDPNLVKVHTEAGKLSTLENLIYDVEKLHLTAQGVKGLLLALKEVEEITKEIINNGTEEEKKKLKGILEKYGLTRIVQRYWGNGS